MTELLVACDVYRAYVRPGRPADAEATARIHEARDRAAAARPDLAAEIGRLADAAVHPSASDDDESDFAVRLQQTWGPVMAKGIEDTTFYRWHLPDRPQRGGRRPGHARVGRPRGAARVGGGPAGALAARHDHAVHPRHQAQRGRPGPDPRARRRRRVVGPVRRGVRRGRRPLRRGPADGAPALADRGRRRRRRRRAARRRTSPRPPARPSSTPPGSTATPTTRSGSPPWRRPPSRPAPSVRWSRPRSTTTGRRSGPPCSARSCSS